MAIKTIIIDLGGVIIDINYQKTLDAFRELGAINIDSVYTQSKQDSLFDEFDIGTISAVDFRAKLQNKLNISVSDEDFDKAWNAMLLNLPMARLHFIKSLKDQGYTVFLFSNINEIHYPEVFRICQNENGIDNFNEFFDHQYYSHIFGKRKPNVDAFKSILDENNIKAEETLFVDDSLQHVLGAKAAGLHAIHITADKSIFGIHSFIENLSTKNTREDALSSELSSTYYPI